MNEENRVRVDPEFERLHDASRDHLWRLPQLSTREKVLLAVVSDVCVGAAGRSFENDVAVGLRSGMSIEEIRQALRFIAFEAGYAVVAEALERLESLDTGPDDRTDGAGPPAAPVMPPAETRAMWRSLDEGFGEYMELQVGMVGGLPGLSVRERAFTSLACDVAHQTLGETFEVHLRRALNDGVPVEDVRAVLVFGAQFGVPKTWNAFRALERCLTSVGEK